VIAGGYESVYFRWPDMRAFRHPICGPGDWEAFEPEQFRVSGDPALPDTPADVTDFRRFMSHVPADLVARVGRFPEDHWALLSWLARAGVVGDDLLASNPCLALMLAKAPSFGARSARTMPIWAVRPYSPQKDLLGKLGFRATEATRRLVHKVIFTAMSIPRLRPFRGAIRSQSDLVARLSHIRRVNANVLAAVGGGGLQVTPRLLTRLSDPANDDPAATLGSAIADTVRGWRLLHPRRSLPVFDCVAHIHRLHEQVVEELSLHKGRGTLPFPAPPVEGTDTIVPLRNALELVVEGRDQHNCVASYERLARRGDVALYRVTAPERATLSLVPDGRKWKVSELKGTCNRRVSSATRTAVNRWLDEASL
jgi:hypothetical protein